MSLRDGYRQKIEAQAEEQKARLDVLKAQAKRALADGKIMAYEELADAEQKLVHLKTRLKDLGNASEGAWEEMKSGVEKAWTDLRDSCKKATAKFGTKERSPQDQKPE